MRLRVLATSSVLFLLIGLAFGRVQAAPPEKCRCLIGSQSNAGSEVENATYCTQEARTDRGGTNTWCQITAECLRGNHGPNCTKQGAIGQSVGGESLLKEIYPVFREIIGKSTFLLDSSDIGGALERIWGIYGRSARAQLDACTDAFRARKAYGIDDSGRLVPFERADAPFGAIIYCVADPLSGYLHFLLELPEVRLKAASIGVRNERGTSTLGIHVIGRQ